MSLGGVTVEFRRSRKKVDISALKNKLALGKKSENINEQKLDPKESAARLITPSIESKQVSTAKEVMQNRATAIKKNLNLTMSLGSNSSKNLHKKQYKVSANDYAGSLKRVHSTDKERKQKVNKLRLSVEDSTTQDTISTQDTMSEGARVRRVMRNNLSIRRRSSSRGSKKVSHIVRKISIAKEVSLLTLAREMCIKINILRNRIKGFAIVDYDHIPYDVASQIVRMFGHESEAIKDNAEKINDILSSSIKQSCNLVHRPPIVAVMGHVDHGKTSLLDCIRNTSVADREAGGITQSIGAYRVLLKNNDSITYIDTPGHEAFTFMRMRGANVTDIAILVIAATDSVKDQTIEAINHAKSAKVPIIIAITKIDMPGSNTQKVHEDLARHDIVTEYLNGDTLYVNVSSKTGEGIDELQEMILLQFEMMDIKADITSDAVGVVLESRMDAKIGPIASVIVQNGTLHCHNLIVSGSVRGKIRSLRNDSGVMITEAGPSTPAEIMGLDSLPGAGDMFHVVQSISDAKYISEHNQPDTSQRSQNTQIDRDEISNLDALINDADDIQEVKIIVKSDTEGSREVLVSSISKLDIENVRYVILHSGVGKISESDAMLAKVSNAIIIAFNIKGDVRSRSIIKENNTRVISHRVIYSVIDDLKLMVLGNNTDNAQQEVIVGVAEIRNIFRVSKIGNIAGSYITKGKITRGCAVRILRDSVMIYESVIESLRHIKDNVKELGKGYECGISIAKFQDFKLGDIIECFTME